MELAGCQIDQQGDDPRQDFQCACPRDHVLEVQHQNQTNRDSMACF